MVDKKNDMLLSSIWGLVMTKLCKLQIDYFKLLRKSVRKHVSVVFSFKQLTV